MTGYIDPSRAQFANMMKLADDGPIWMLNIIKLKKTATYDDGLTATGAEAYAAYGRESEKFFKKVGGKIVWSGSPKLVLIGPEEEKWDICFVAEYPSASAFGEMVKDEGYHAIVYHRQAAVETSRLIRMQPGNAGKLFG